MARKRILHEITLDKIAAVTVPCQEHATNVLFKVRSYTENERKAMADKGEALPDGSFPIKNKGDLKAAVQAHGRAADKPKAKKHIVARATALDAMDELPEGWAAEPTPDPDADSGVGKAIAFLAKLDIPAARGFAEVLAQNEAQEASWEAESKMWPLFDALRVSLGSIATDPAVADKLGAAQETVQEFIGALKSEWPDVAEAVDKIAKASPNAADMAVFIKAGLAGGSAKETNMADVKEADLNKAAETLTSDIPEVQAIIDKAKAAGKKDAETDWLDADGKPTKKAADLVAKHAPTDAEEILKSGDVTIKKSVVGADTFNFMKAQQEEIAKQRDAAELATLSKQAADELPSLPGTDVEKAAVLRVIKSAPEAVRKTAEAIFAAAEKTSKGAFETKGSGSAPGGGEPGTIAKAKEDFMSKVSEIQSKDGLGKVKAMEKAEREHPALFKAYREATAA